MNFQFNDLLVRRSVVSGCELNSRLYINYRDNDHPHKQMWHTVGAVLSYHARQKYAVDTIDRTIVDTVFFHDIDNTLQLSEALKNFCCVLDNEGLKIVGKLQSNVDDDSAPAQLVHLLGIMRDLREVITGENVELLLRKDFDASSKKSFPDCSTLTCTGPLEKLIAVTLREELSNTLGIFVLFKITTLTAISLACMEADLSWGEIRPSDCHNVSDLMVHLDITDARFSYPPSISSPEPSSIYIPPVDFCATLFSQVFVGLIERFYTWPLNADVAAHLRIDAKSFFARYGGRNDQRWIRFVRSSKSNESRLYIRTDLLKEHYDTVARGMSTGTTCALPQAEKQFADSYARLIDACSDFIRVDRETAETWTPYLFYEQSHEYRTSGYRDERLRDFFELCVQRTLCSKGITRSQAERTSAYLLDLPNKFVHTVVTEKRLLEIFVNMMSELPFLHDLIGNVSSG